MLERAHSVVDRSMVPQKRQKIHDTWQDDGRRATFNGGANGGVLGQYVRDKQEEGRMKKPSSTTAVDLTEGELVCYKPE